MSKNIKAIIFDLDGVIINSNPAIVSFWKEWAEKEQIQLTDAMLMEWVYGRKVTATIEGIFNHISDQRKNEIKEAGYLFDQNMQPESVLGVQGFIKKLATINFPLGVVTSSHHQRMYQMLQQVNVANEFTNFITAHDVDNGKPHPEPYLKMAEKLGVHPSTCLVFEDAISGIQSATAAGMTVIGIGEKQNASNLLKAGAKELIEDFLSIEINNNHLRTKNENVYWLIQ
jgi:HAD superfamily hydrolase (TIGR01509 family)